MKIYRDIDTLATSRATAVTVGSFDGVHAGHGVLLSRLSDMARAIDAESVVVTFEPHPRIAMGRAAGMGLLTTVEERAYLLAQHGVDNLVVVHFDEAFRQQSYEEFVRNRLVARLGMRGIGRLYTCATADQKSPIEELRTLYEDVKAADKSVAMPASMVVGAPRSSRPTLTTIDSEAMTAEEVEPIYPSMVTRSATIATCASEHISRHIMRDRGER